MDRRAFVATAIVLAAFPASRVRSQGFSEAEDWKVFTQLSELFLQIVRSTDPIAEYITKKRFLRFLEGMDRTLGNTVKGKRDVLRVIETDYCSDPTNGAKQRLQLSMESLSNALDALAVQADTLSICIRPPELREKATRVAEDLYSLVVSRKTWMARASTYCDSSSAQKTKFRQEIEMSIDFVEKSRQALRELIKDTRDL